MRVTFVMLKVCKIKFKLRVILQFKQSKNFSMSLNCHLGKHRAKNRLFWHFWTLEKEEVMSRTYTKHYYSVSTCQEQESKYHQEIQSEPHRTEQA